MSPLQRSQKWLFIDGIDQSSGQTAPLFNPREHVWTDHFNWSIEDPSLLKGKTPLGRATINRLMINAPEIVTVRRLLRDLGVWKDAE